MKPLSSLPRGAEVLLDANIIVYALSGRSSECDDLLARCGAGDVSGFTTVEALADACHRLMLFEATAKGLIARPNAANLKGKSLVVRQLTDYWRRIMSIPAQSIAILPLDEFRFQRAYQLRTAHGQMTNDSILLAAAQVFGIGALATNDSDFDAVPWLDVYKPTDVS